MPALVLPPLPDALPDGGPLLVALSGGLDSTVLLHLAAGSELARTRGLTALHVDHGLHPDSHRWAAHCRAACAALDIPLEVARVEVALDGGRGPEAAAREARHAAYARALPAGAILLLAHHRDDQAETFLLRALRGAGTDGLASMRPLRRFGEGWLWRPLLEWPRERLLRHAREEGLAWIEDPSNADTSLDRNHLRHAVMPRLRERWPHAIDGLARSAALAAEARTLLEAGDAAALAGIRTADPSCLDAGRLATLPRARRARVLRAWAQSLALPPLPGEGIDRIERDLLGAAPDSDATFAWSGHRIRAWGGLLHGGPILPPLPVDWSSDWDGRAPLPLPGGGALCLEGVAAFDAPCRVHARAGGERIRLPGRRHSHALKHVLQDLGVPPWTRARMPCLSDAEGGLLAIGDLAYSAGFEEWLRARGARLRWMDVLDTPCRKRE